MDDHLWDNAERILEKIESFGVDAGVENITIRNGRDTYSLSSFWNDVRSVLSDKKYGKFAVFGESIKKQVELFKGAPDSSGIRDNYLSAAVDLVSMKKAIFTEK